jgi:hypothetical protein
MVVATVAATVTVTVTVMGMVTVPASEPVLVVGLLLVVPVERWDRRETQGWYTVHP